MPCLTQLKLGSPLFLAAVVIATAKASSLPDGEGCAVPKLQSVHSYTHSSARPAQYSARRRTAVVAIRIVAKYFIAAGLRAPAGVWDGVDPPSNLGGHMAWIQLLGNLCAHEAIQLLVENWSAVPTALVSRTELEYNRGIEACSQQATDSVPLPDRLQQGQLCARVSVLIEQVPCPGESACSSRETVEELARCAGHFYYIAAGVGCGISEIQQVRTLSPSRTCKLQPLIMTACAFGAGWIQMCGGLREGPILC